MTKIVNLDTETFDEGIKRGLVLVDFLATWCAPCQMYGKILEDFANEAPAYLKIAKVEVEANIKLAERFEVMSVPRTILFRDGKPVAEASGVQTKMQLMELLKKG
jgi:thioredoxin 1